MVVGQRCRIACWCTDFPNKRFEKIYIWYSTVARWREKNEWSRLFIYYYSFLLLPFIPSFPLVLLPSFLVCWGVKREIGGYFVFEVIGFYRQTRGKGVKNNSNLELYAQPRMLDFCFLLTPSWRVGGDWGRRGGIPSVACRGAAGLVHCACNMERNVILYCHRKESKDTTSVGRMATVHCYVPIVIMNGCVEGGRKGREECWWLCVCLSCVRFFVFCVWDVLWYAGLVVFTTSYVFQVAVCTLHFCPRFLYIAFNALFVASSFFVLFFVLFCFLGGRRGGLPSTSTGAVSVVQPVVLILNDYWWSDSRRACYTSTPPTDDAPNFPRVSFVDFFFVSFDGQGPRLGEGSRAC